MRELALISVLSDGRFHSGEVLGKMLGVSRAAVWKRLQGLALYGLEIESVRGKGYRISGGLSLLSEEAVLSFADLSADALDLDLRTETGSTNVDALYAARERLVRPYAVIAEYQSSGRGRRGRVWQSPFASSIYLSLAVEITGGAAKLEGLSLAVGVVVAELLAAHSISDVSVKWPNDILVRGKKIGGILIELTGDLDASCRAIIGVGINGALPAAVEIDQPATDLHQELGLRPDRNQWVGQLLSALIAMSEQFSEKGFSNFQRRWERFDSMLGRSVRVIQGEREVHGIARGVTERGALLVETEGLITEYHGGEVSLRAI